MLSLISVYLLWKLLHYYFTQSTGLIHHYWLSLVFKMGAFYAAITSFVLNIFDEPTIYRGITVFYLSTGRSIRVEDHCLAIPAMVIFTGSIMLFSGNWKNKLWFVPLGLFFIFIINLLRLVFVCVAFQHMSAVYYNIHHTLIYVIATYTVIFLMIAWWMKRFGKPTNNS